jgi:pyruvate/2-oxoglutarate dehydrogenase complex dihydrolipoamide dehydrogenase (E3) component
LESQLLGDGSRTTTGRIIPYAIFTDPELGRVGITEKEARRLHDGHIKVGSFAMKQNGKATELGETQGFIRLIADTRDNRLLGAALLTAEGAELVASCITLMNAEATLTRIREGIYIHPTLSEAMQGAVLALNP